MKMVIMTKWGRAVAAVTGVLLLLAGAACSAHSQAAPGTLSIVVAFYPFQFIAERVAGPAATVTSLTKPGAEPHDLELTAKQVASVTTADLVIYERSFQAAVDEAVDQSGNDHVLDTASVVPLVPLTEGAHNHNEGSDGSPRDHDHGNGLDPHVWLDPNNMITIADAVAEQLAGIAPDHADQFRANAKALDTQLRQVDASYRATLTHCDRTEFITTHAAFGYLARRYHLEQIAIDGLSPDAQPSPARIAEVQREAKEHQVTTIFYETLVSPAVATSIARDLGLTTDVLDPIEGITDTSRGRDYLAVMRSNLTALSTANGCT